MTHQYRGFGLNIASEIEFPELLPLRFTTPDITISVRKDIDEITGEKTIHHDHTVIINDAEFYLDITGVCKYYVKDTHAIYIAPYSGIDDRSVRLYLLGTIMAYVLFRLALIPLHASAIIKNDKLVLFTGDSGAGKSTTLTKLALRGYTVFTDDICVIDKEGKGVASYPMIKLWDDALEKLNNPAFSNKDFKIRPGMDKYGYFFHDSFNTHAVPIDTIFIIRTDNFPGSPPQQQLTGHKAFDALAHQVYRRYLVIGPELRTLYFKRVAMLAHNCRVIEIHRQPANDPEKFIDKIESLITQYTTAGS
jgi:hypothetical protein